jgi:hypothetical protein
MSSAPQKDGASQRNCGPTVGGSASAHAVHLQLSGLFYNRLAVHLVELQNLRAATASLLWTSTG